MAPHAGETEASARFELAIGTLQVPALPLGQEAMVAYIRPSRPKPLGGLGYKLTVLALGLGPRISSFRARSLTNLAKLEYVNPYSQDFVEAHHLSQTPESLPVRVPLPATRPSRTTPFGLLRRAQAVSLPLPIRLSLVGAEWRASSLFPHRPDALAVLNFL